MSVLRINTDNPADVAKLREAMHYEGPQVFPRKTRYGDWDALAKGLEPVEAIPDVLVPKDSFKEVIAAAEKARSFPIHHMYDTWCPKGTKFNQNGLGYCWTWSATACLMTVRASEVKPFVSLAPVSMGYLVGWRNEGNYLEAVINGLREKGVCPGDFNSLQNKASAWSALDSERSKYRLRAVWDTNPRAGDATMIQHCLSILAYGRPLHGAWNWWGHAVAIVGMRWDESLLNNVAFILRNSHNESDVIELTGSRAVPDEAYGYISTEVEE
jgi:hypothetical protein